MLMQNHNSLHDWNISHECSGGAVPLELLFCHCALLQSLPQEWPQAHLNLNHRIIQRPFQIPGLQEWELSDHPYCIVILHTHHRRCITIICTRSTVGYCWTHHGSVSIGPWGASPSWNQSLISDFWLSSCFGWLLDYCCSLVSLGRMDITKGVRWCICVLLPHFTKCTLLQTCFNLACYGNCTIPAGCKSTSTCWVCGCWENSLSPQLWLVPPSCSRVHIDDKIL